MYKIFVTAPESHTDSIIKAMSDSGAGVIGSYTHCAFITKGFGNFTPSDTAKPFVGQIGEMNREPEDKIEMICPKEKLDLVIQAIKSVHPYESPTIDVIEIQFFT